MCRIRELGVAGFGIGVERFAVVWAGDMALEHQLIM